MSALPDRSVEAIQACHKRNTWSAVCLLLVALAGLLVVAAWSLDFGVAIFAVGALGMFKQWICMRRDCRDAEAWLRFAHQDFRLDPRVD